MGDPSYIQDMNRFIEELNKVKVNNPNTDDIYGNIVKDFKNTMQDIKVSQRLNDLDDVLNLSKLSEKEKREYRRHNQINRYYQKRYERQIVILQKIVAFFCIAILGTLLPDSVRPVFMGVLFAIGFVALFYDLWDVYLRDSRDFEQYDFNFFYTKPRDADPNHLVLGDLKDVKYCE
jgi:hypothetical protein